MGRRTPEGKSDIAEPSCVSDIAELQECVERGYAGKLAMRKLRPPLSEVIVETAPLESGTEFDVAIKLPYVRTGGHEKLLAEDLVTAVGKSDNISADVEDSETHSRLCTKRGHTFLLWQDPDRTQTIHLSVARVKTKDDEGVQVHSLGSGVPTNPESLKSTIDDLYQTTQEVMSEAYALRDTDPENTAFTISAPKQPKAGEYGSFTRQMPEPDGARESSEAPTLFPPEAERPWSQPTPRFARALGEPADPISQMERDRVDAIVSRLHIERPAVRFADIGGQAAAVREITELATALRNPEAYEQWGTKMPKGILLEGPPGTGKTLLAQALAAEGDAHFLHVQASDISSSLWGEEERIVRQIFKHASGLGRPSVIFFDELDAIAAHREHSGPSHRVVSAILENLGGMQANENVMVLAATNHPKGIDPAVSRAGRFDRIIEMPKPDTPGRKEILRIHIQQAEERAGGHLFKRMNAQRLAEATGGMTGADIAEIVRRTLEGKARAEASGESPGLVTGGELMQEIKSYERRKRAMGFI